MLSLNTTINACGVSHRTLEVQSLRSPFLCLLVALLVAMPAQRALYAASPDLGGKRHAWAKFKPGAWKKVREITETLDEKGAVVSTSTTHTTSVLENVNEDRYELAVEVSVEVAGRKFDTPTQSVDQGYYGESQGQTSATKGITPGSVLIDGRRVPCKLYEVFINGGPRRRRAKIYFSETLAPYVLKKVSVTTDSVGENVLNETSETVLAVDLPQRILSRILTTSRVKTVRKHPKGVTTTLAVHADRVPGGVVSHTSEELDANGRLIRRSTLELLDYGLEAEDQPVLRRRQLRRAQRRRGR